MVSSKSQNPELATRFISHMVSDPQARSFAEKIGGVVSNPTVIDKVDGSRWINFFAKDMARTTQPVDVLDVALNASLANAYLDAGVEILNGTMTPEQAMSKIRKVALDAKYK